MGVCLLRAALGAGRHGGGPVYSEKEGIPLGKGLAYIMVTALLDNLYYVLMVPLVVLIAGAGLYPHEALQTGFVATLRMAFVVSYVFVTPTRG